VDLEGWWSMSAAKKRPTATATKTPRRAKATTRAGGTRTKSAAKTGSARVEPAILDRLVQEAKAVRENAYAPFSRYRVGAAIMTRAGNVYRGCNVENSTFGATICAERGAIMQMVASGETDPVACAVVTRDGGSPCGICRQVLAEFALDMPVVLVGLESPEGEAGHVMQLSDLLPLAFRMKK
jgi:cytidine deaminase